MKLHYVYFHTYLTLSFSDVSLIDEMDYASADTVPSMAIRFKPNTALRPYQRFAVNRVFWNKSQCHSGVLVLPCGAGKTLIGKFSTKTRFLC